MNGPEHYRLAEQSASASEYAYGKWRTLGNYDDLTAAVWHQNQGRLYAALANAAVLADAFGIVWDAEQRAAAEEWADVQNVARPAEPLVTCPTTTEEGRVRCCLPVGHDGPHEDDSGEMPLLWSSDADLAVISPKPPPARCPEEDGAGTPCILEAGHPLPHAAYLSAPKLVSPVCSACGHREGQHAPHLDGHKPRGVCLTNCGCIFYQAQTAETF